MNSILFTILCLLPFIAGQSACSSNPCQNGATCVSNGNTTFTCACPTGFYGNQCQAADCRPRSLYLCTGDSPSSIYEVNYLTGTTTLIGSSVNMNQCGGMAEDPITGILYAVGGSNTFGFAFFSINKLSGLATQIGAGANTSPCPGGGAINTDIEFRYPGDKVLFGGITSGATDCIFTIDITNGVRSLVGSTAPTVSTSGDGLIFSANGTILYYTHADNLTIADQNNGHLTTVDKLSNFAMGATNSMVEGLTRLYTAPHFNFSVFGLDIFNGGPPTKTLDHLNLDTGVLTPVATIISVSNPTGLAAITLSGSGTCLNGAACNSNPFMNLTSGCGCLSGFSGDICQTNINECSSNPCQNGGTCVDQINSFTCSCPSGFTGTMCQNAGTVCDSNPCQNLGSCTPCS
jgi:hypothetical protein